MGAAGHYLVVLLGFISLITLGLNAAPRPVSTPPFFGDSGAGDSFAPGFSADGRFVVFVSHANNLVTNDDHGLKQDVFVRDLVSSNTTLVSVSASGVGGANNNAFSPSISSNGQFVAFASRASNLVNGDTNNACDVFLRDIAGKTTRLVSVDVTGTKNALGPSLTAQYPLESSYPLISADGRWVVFQSSASNLVSLPDVNRATDVFTRDMQSNVTYLVSISADGASSSSDASEMCGMTPDGRFVAFTSTAYDIVDGTDWVSEDLYVRDIKSNQMFWVTANLYQYLASPYRAFNAELSVDGRYVAFKAQEVGHTNIFVFRQDLQSGTTILVASNSVETTDGSMSADGRYIATVTYDSILVFDAQQSELSRIVTCSSSLPPELQSLAWGSVAYGLASTPVLSADAAKVVFLFSLPTGNSNNLNWYHQIYAMDLNTGSADLVSIRTNGVFADYGLFGTVPAISADGSKVAFESPDDYLVAGDNNRASDVFLRDLNTGTTDLISVRDPRLPDTTGAGLSWIEPNCVSADGNTIVFSSFDNNLHELDLNTTQDTWVRNMKTNTAESLTYPIPQGGGETGYLPPLWFTNRGSGSPFVSANGQYATYVYGGNNARYPTASVYRRKLPGTNFAAVANAGNIGGGLAVTRETQWFPAAPVSSDGRYVTYVNIGNSNIFMVDIESGKNYGLTAVGLNNYYGPYFGSPKISPDDRWVLYISSLYNNYGFTYTGPSTVYAMDIVGYLAAVKESSNAFVYPSNFTHLLINASLSSFYDVFTNAVFSGNSRYVAFNGQNLITYRHDLYAPTATNVVVCTNCMSPSMSGDGRFVVFEVPRAGWVNDVYVKDLASGVTELVNVNRSGGLANAGATSAQISWDARYIVFASRASDLVANDTNRLTDVFVRDRVRGVTMLVSGNLSGTGSGNSGSANPVLAADGRTVVFQSFATDLAPGVYNDTRNIFLMRLGGADTDGDGMDDDWEVAFFGSFSRDGAGDFDVDGMSDLQEFLAGTDPTNLGSVLRVVTVSLASGGSTGLYWGASPGKSYRVEYKDDLGAATWKELSRVMATSTSASAVDASPDSSHRFYRVVLE
jgi:Tol biopolymer transport system component